MDQNLITHRRLAKCQMIDRISSDSIHSPLRPFETHETRGMNNKRSEVAREHFTEWEETRETRGIRYDTMRYLGKSAPKQFRDDAR